MSTPNTLPSERVSPIVVLAPVSSATGQVSGWASAANFRRFMAIASVGVFGSSATVDFKLQQAKTSGGGSAKDIPGAAITQLLAAGGNGRQVIINLDTDSLDTANGFGYVGMTLTVGTAASLVGAELYGFDPLNGPASAVNPAAVAQIVSV
jgi:hypothetical protein